MCNLGIFNYDDHCTVVVVIHLRLIFIVKRIWFVKFGKDVFLRFRLTLVSAQKGEWRSYTCESERIVFTMGFLWPSLGFLCLWAGFLVSLRGIHLSPVLPMGFHRAWTKHILLLSTREEKNPTSATSGNRKNSLRFYGGRGDMMFLLVFGLYVCVCGCAGLYVCARVSACLWKLWIRLGKRKTIWCALTHDWAGRVREWMREGDSEIGEGWLFVHHEISSLMHA